VTSTHLGGRLLSASQLPLFWLRPPSGYGVLTTTGRKSGKRRRRCVRAVTDGVRGHTHWGTAREPRDAAERQRGMEVYSGGEVGSFERLEYRLWSQGRPTPERIRELHRSWFERGSPFVIELRRR
jgi:hypothetical protein